MGSGVHDRLKRRHDPRHLCRRRHAGQQSPEVHVLHSRDDVLPAIRRKHCGLDARRLFGRELATGDPHEVACIRLGLRLENAVDGADQCDEVIDRLIAFTCCNWTMR